MNKREFLEMVKNGEMDSSIMEFAVNELEKMDIANEKRKAKTAEKNAEKEVERAELRAALMEVMSDEFKAAADLIDAAGLDVTPQAAAYALRQPIEAGEVVKGKVNGGKHVGYKLA